MEISSPIEPNSPTPSTSPIPSQSLTPPTKSSKRSLLRFVVIFQFLIILGLAGLLGYLYYRDSEWQEFPDTEFEDVVPDEAVLPSPESIQLSDVQLFFARGNEVWAIKNNGQEQQVTHTQDGIVHYDFSDDHTKLVYIQGRPYKNSSEYPLIEPNRVMYHNLITGEQRSVFEFDEVTQPNSEYVLGIKDVSISEDGKVVAYSTHDSIYTYDPITDESKRVFSAPRPDDIQGGAGIFSYSWLQFSPDHQKLLIHKGYYEGHEPAVVEISTGTLYDLPVVDPSYGTRSTQNWINSNDIASYDFRSDSIPLPEVTFQIFDWKGQVTLQPRDTKGYFPDTLLVTKDGQFGYGVSVKNENETYSSTISRINLSNDEREDVYVFTHSREEHYYLMSLSLDEKSLYIQYSPDFEFGSSEKTKLLKLDLTTQNARPIELTTNGAIGVKVN